MSLSLRKLEAEAGQKARREKHGVIGYLNTGKLPSGRAWKREQEKVSKIRLALIDQYGGDKIKPAVLALIESAVQGLMIQHLSALYVKKAGILRADSLAEGNLELHAILSGQFVAYANLVRLNLEAAGRLAKEAGAEHVPSPLEVAAIIDAEKAEKTAQDAGGPTEDQDDEEIGAPEPNGAGCCHDPGGDDGDE